MIGTVAAPVPGTNIPSGSEVSPGGMQGIMGAQGPQGIQGPTGATGPTGVSANAGNVAKLGTDNLILVAQGDVSTLVTAARVDTLAAPTDNTASNVSSSAHGFMPKLPNTGTAYFRDDGAWVLPTDYYGTDTTNSGAYVVTVRSDFVLQAGVTVFVTPTNAATANPTLNVNGTGAKAVVNRANIALLANELSASKTFGVMYDGTSWRVITHLYRVYNGLLNPGSPTIECLGFDGVCAVWAWSGSAASLVGITLAHLSYGTPVFIKAYNGATVACTYWINATTTAGAALPTYFVWANAVGGGLGTRIDSTAAASSVPVGNNIVLNGSLTGGNELIFL
jgi:hypothetical protein